ncbi:DUF1801 domain-containing protein [Weeksellaceae bacterium KMM 9713]|uniref:DUF1801 domain-containing protein n=1 Tax=Profundicola chukchiensis TaxID=2961959 RepID=A0A9X4MYP2_9FLAO|nr:DUF1801 domain-containing protein [Profundicola chukchiensis]MDG4946444.1 DUF1801 domain-containing protein [Profundicola chukchiensis]
MAQNKTQPTEVNVIDFIHSFANTDQKIKDSLELIEIMKEVSGFEPKMWGPSIIGFGEYHYKYASGHEGNAPLLGFSPRKSAISLYAYSGSEEHKHLLENLGKFKMGKSCIYINKLADINIEELKTLMKETIQFLKTTYG